MVLFFSVLILVAVVIPAALSAWIYRRPHGVTKEPADRPAEALSDEAASIAMRPSGSLYGGRM